MREPRTILARNYVERCLEIYFLGLGRSNLQLCNGLNLASIHWHFVYGHDDFSSWNQLEVPRLRVGLPLKARGKAPIFYTERLAQLLRL